MMLLGSVAAVRYRPSRGSRTIPSSASDVLL